MNTTSAKAFDNEKLTFTVPGDPTPWARCGYGRGKFYDKQKHHKLAFGIYIKNQLPPEFTPFSSKPLRIDTTFYFKIPKRTGKNSHKKPNYYHYFKPDKDNLNKFVFDALHDIIYTNDCCIADGRSQKRYDYEPRTEIIIYPLEML